MAFKDIENILPLVQKPARYIGTELNSVHKKWETTPVKICLAVPDLYEIGMSNMGLQILYHVLNSEPDTLCERVFAPYPDLRKIIEEIFSLESFQPLKNFDLIGFSAQHELTYTNILTILDTANIPLYRKDRDEKYPLIFAGGPSTTNPMPIADFFDFFVIGEAEEVIVEVKNFYKENKNLTREEFFKKIVQIKGIYVPSLNNPTEKRIIENLDNVPYPTKPIVPFIQTVHDRVALEIMRGCKWGCKFCHAGYTCRPVRTRSPEKLLEIAKETIKNTGYQEISLLSLSTSDYPQIEKLVKLLADEFSKKKISINIPSIRANIKSIRLLTEILRVRPSNLTIAPEAGTQRLRDVIGKNLTEEEILGGCETAFKAGVSSIKLYFMIGLPTETEEDLTGICSLAEKIYSIGQKISRRASITVNLSTFVPKPHTPFEREAQISIEETYEKQKIIKRMITNRKIQVRWHQAEISFLEGIFARGDNKLSKLLVTAWKMGATLDAWSEHFNFAIWQEAIKATGIDAEKYLKAKAPNEELPYAAIKS